MYAHFQIERLKNKFVAAEKELQEAKRNNAALTRYINAKRKKEEDRRKEEARKGRGGPKLQRPLPSC
jgi:hypothetical protein